MRQLGRGTLFGAVILAAIMITSCGSGKKQSTGADGAAPDFGTDAAGVSYVGAAACISCHEGFTWSADEVANFLEGAHVIHSDHISASRENEAEGCLVCHAPIGDSAGIEPLIDPAAVPQEGLAAVTCEACHGAGGSHYGVGPIPAPTPQADACGACHIETLPDSHLAFHPEGFGIYEDYIASPHTASINEAVLVDKSVPDEVRAKCSMCHTNEGAKLYKHVEGGYQDIVDAFPDSVLPVTGATAVQCATCHDAHKPESLLLAEALGDDGAVEESAEYRTCTHCHQTDDSYHGESSAMNWTDGVLDTSRLIYDTHFDNSVTDTVIEGYVLDAADSRSCRDCHNVHSADTAINQQWARSAHGGYILDSILNSGIANVVDATAPGWVHYDFKDNGDPADPTDFGRQACQRCHTATGFRNYASDPAAYDADGDGYPDTLNVFTATGGQKEMLYCWACHTDNSGGIRNPGAITVDYTDAQHTYGDISYSNVCIACHTGRESGDTIKNSTDDFTNKRFVNSHYLAAGGIVFAVTGYEYDGQDYTNPSYYAHDKIGTPESEEDTGTSGPCVGCHMGASERHLFLPVEKDPAGAVTSITAEDALCSKCHTGEFDLTPAEIDEQKAGFDNALTALSDTLSLAGFAFTTGYPYFANTNWTTASDPTGKLTMGAAFNFNLLYHDPGAFAHNRFYARRLIFDSIDFMDNGVLNGAINLLSYPAAAEWMQNDGDATNDGYLLRP